MTIRRLLAAIVAALLLIGCAPDQISPGGGTPDEQSTEQPTSTPSDAPTTDPTSSPTSTPAEPGGDPYDY